MQLLISEMCHFSLIWVLRKMDKLVKQNSKDIVCQHIKLDIWHEVARKNRFVSIVFYTLKTGEKMTKNEFWTAIYLTILWSKSQVPFECIVKHGLEGTVNKKLVFASPLCYKMHFYNFVIFNMWAYNIYFHQVSGWLCS